MQCFKLYLCRFILEDKDGSYFQAMPLLPDSGAHYNQMWSSIFQLGQEHKMDQ